MKRRSPVPGSIIKYVYYRIISIYYFLIEIMIPVKITDYRKIPIIINNFNRLTFLKILINSLEKRGYLNIIILDNQSTYPPLLEYYKQINYEVIFLKSNFGMDALWISGVFRRFKRDFFVYTDPDVVPVDECPDDFMLFFLNSLKKYRLASKVGFSLMIDDIPDCFAFKKQVVESEEHFFTDLRREEHLYWAPIDTTFALYRPRAKRRHANNNIEMYRTGFPYMARHLPWYSDSSNPDEETRYYLDQIVKKTSWSGRSRSLTGTSDISSPTGIGQKVI